MDVERLRQVLRDLPNQVDVAAAQLKEVAAQVERQLEAFGPLLDNLSKAGGSPWAFVKDNVQAPMSREQKIQWLKDNVAGIKVAGIDALSDDYVNDVYGYWYNRGKGV